jgi:hypothetical protein
VTKDGLGQNAIALVPPLISAGISIALFQGGGFFYILFLVPLGILAYISSTKIAWIACAIAFIGNILVFLVALFYDNQVADWIVFAWKCGSIGLVLALWTWIMSPPFQSFSTANRLVISGAVVFILFLIDIFRTDYSVFLQYMETSVKNTLDFTAESGIVQVDLDAIEVRNVINKTISFILNGAGLAVMLVFFAINRQVSVFLSQIVKPTKKTRHLTDYHVESRLIWLLIFALLGAVSFRRAGLSAMEVIAWNVVTVCIFLYTVQGLGIVFYYLSKTARSSITRLFQVVLITIIVIMPVINLIVCGGVLVLGIAENWVPLRNETSSS